MPAKLSIFERFGLNRPELRAWALYDVANSAFATTIMVAVLPIYFSDVLAKDILQPNEVSAYWGYFNSLSMLAVALVSPAAGYLADLYAGKRFGVAVFTFIGVLTCFGLAIVEKGQWLAAGLIFALGAFCFNLGIVFYESMLPHIAKNEAEMHLVSNSGYAVGYLSGGVLLAVNLAWIMKPEFFGLADATQAIKLSFVSVGVCWFLFSIPLLRRVPEPKVAAKSHKPSLKTLVWQSTFKLFVSVWELRRYPQALMFLFAFFAFGDGIGTIMIMAIVYGREVGIESNTLIQAILLVQFLGVPASFLFGPLSNKFGPKKALMMGLTVYTIVAAIGYFMTTALHFWLLAVGVALVQGGSQAISRSIFASLIPEVRSGEFFGLYSIFSKVSGLFGPFVFAIIAENTGGSRLSVLFVIALFVVGMVLLNFVDLEKGRKQALSPS